MVTREWLSVINLRRLSCLGLLLSVLSACTFGFTYRQLDWLIPWHLSDYISFEYDQRSELERRLDERLEWHCRTQLEAYAEWFRELYTEPLPVTRERLEYHYGRSLVFWDVLMESLTPDITALLLTASEAQAKELMRNLERRNLELEKRYVTARWKTVRQRRVDRMAEILQRWIGPLSSSQYRVLERWSQDLGQSGAAWMKSRRRWQRALEESFALRGDRERFAARIHTLFVDPQQLWPESYRREYSRLEDRTLEMLVEIAAEETPEQERHFRNELLSWTEDFEELACNPPGD